MPEARIAICPEDIEYLEAKCSNPECGATSTVPIIEPPSAKKSTAFCRCPYCEAGDAKERLLLREIAKHLGLLSKSNPLRIRLVYRDRSGDR